MKISLKGTTIYYESFGDGPHTVLFFHGWGMNGESWRPLLSRFPLAGHRLVVPDLRGFGRSEKPVSGYHIDDYMRDAVRLLRALNIPRADVVGHSFGGTGALYLAARIPHLVRRVAVIDTIAGAKNTSIDPRVRTQFERIRNLVQKVGDTALPTLMMRIWRQSFLTQPSDAMAALQQSAAESSMRHALLGTLNTILTTDISEWMTRLRVPALIIRGSDDPVLHGGPDGLEAARTASRVTIANTGHYPHLEDPDAVSRHLIAFFGAGTPSFAL